MAKYGVSFITDLYYEVDAESFDEAIDIAYELLQQENMFDLDWDCNEAIDLDEKWYK